MKSDARRAAEAAHDAACEGWRRTADGAEHQAIYGEIGARVTRYREERKAWIAAQSKRMEDDIAEMYQRQRRLRASPAYQALRAEIRLIWERYETAKREGMA